MQYSRSWRLLHWLIALCVIALVPVGLLIEARTEANLWDRTTDILYGLHKTLGFSVLVLMLLRIGCKLWLQAPAYPDTLSRRQILAAKSLHHLFYVLLILVPLLGWAGVTAFPALMIIPGVELPPMPGIPRDPVLAERLFGVHGAFALLLALLALGHIVAALWHRFVLHDEVFQRMGFRHLSDKEHKS
ncbi:MAG: cytochrome b [Gammaproteobacteria bacterium]|nr:cytochrome b [Pseudomonadales bacterium]MCP5329519.1 cytochrome b [Pseudomonadales bacterium]